MLESAVRRNPVWKEGRGRERQGLPASPDLEEPPLDDLLNDPLTHQLMASDGIKEKHLLLVIAEAQARLNGA
ncbi:MAG: hypothetical protein FD153_669 [Rhodospirillaceae bacterium]|nr:MAG: hypothetical protein FD153_669 [Rhodospirillaceae bacterium]